MNLVLDTNVVVDWLVFDDPFLNAFRVAVLEKRVLIITHQPAIDELRRVLGYRALKLSVARREAVLLHYHAQTSLAAAPGVPSGDRAALPRGFPRCRDSDDDHFLALAYQARADALVSRDRAVQAVGRRCRAFGFAVLDVPQMAAAVDRLCREANCSKDAAAS